MAVATAILVPPQLVGAQTPAPTISSIAIISSPDDSASYQAGETIQFSVQFTSNVSVSGSPTLAVDVGGDGLRQRPVRVGAGQRGAVRLLGAVARNRHRSPTASASAQSALTLGSGDAITDSLGAGSPTWRTTRCPPTPRTAST